MKATSLFKKLLFLSLVFSFGACEQASETVISIPSVAVGCTTSDDPLCSSTGAPLTAFVQMSRSGCGSSSGFEPIATGSVSLSCDVSGCDGLVSSWIDPDTSSPISEILTGRMDICSNVDLNKNTGDPDTGDLVNESSETINSSSTITIDSWSTF